MSKSCASLQVAHLAKPIILKAEGSIASVVLNDGRPASMSGIASSGANAATIAYEFESALLINNSSLTSRSASFHSSHTCR